eukprot:scaffold528_cov165-Amphora_coffeaeformis.AAC.19
MDGASKASAMFTNYSSRLRKVAFRENEMSFSNEASRNAGTVIVAIPSDTLLKATRTKYKGHNTRKQRTLARNGRIFLCRPSH